MVDSSLFAEMRILIHGTKNAWTTLRPYDLILYELEIKVKGKERGLGVYMPDSSILPLCNYEKGSTEFFVDSLQEAYSAETLRSENRLLRIVSADRRGTDCFVVEEYLDTDILIPVRDALINAVETASSSLITDAAISESVELANVDVQSSNDVVAIKLKPVEIEAELADDIDVQRVMTLFDLEVLELEIKKSTALNNIRLDKINRKKALLKSEHDASCGTAEGSNSLTSVVSPLVPTPIGPYSQAVIANGFVFLSGCIGMDMKTGRIAEGGVEAETRQSLENLRHIIEQSGSSLSKVCKTTLMIRDMSYFSQVNKIYAEYFNLDNGSTALPARSTFEVSFLPLGAFIEIEAICLL